MPYCSNCGTKLEDTHRFCFVCGTPVSQPAAPVQAAVPAIVPAAENTVPPADSGDIAFYEGVERTFTLCGLEFRIPAGMDAFNHYRREFRKFSKKQANLLSQECFSSVYDLDSFLINFPQLYAKHRAPLIENAMNIFFDAGIYDISPEQFEDQHTADFCLCGEDVDTIIESFNLTIEANQEKKIKMYNMMPSVMFHGLTGFAAALALNVAVNEIAEADIRNADVTPAQRAELFGRINFPLLMERAQIDYWRVFLSLTWQMKQRGMNMWYPTDQTNQSSSGLYNNLAAGRIPPNRLPQQLIQLLTCHPFNDDYLKYIRSVVGPTEEMQRILEYFDFEG